MVEHGRLRTQERKVATVLFVDLAESTSLGERLDIEPLAQVMGAFHRAVRQAVEQREGVAEFVGDGVVAIFGAPVAVENHQGRALEAADAINRESDHGPVPSNLTFLARLPMRSSTPSTPSIGGSPPAWAPSSVCGSA